MSDLFTVNGNYYYDDYDAFLNEYQAAGGNLDDADAVNNAYDQWVNGGYGDITVNVSNGNKNNFWLIAVLCAAAALIIYFIFKK